MKTVFLPFLLSLLTPSFVMCQTTRTPSIQVLLGEYSFEVRTGEQWTDTGLDLQRGDKIHVTGNVTACEGPWDSKEHLVLRSAPAGALLVKLHLEAAPIAASPDAELPIQNASHLYLGVNAWQCHTTIPVKVQVQWHK